MKKAILMVVALLAMAGQAEAANERAKRDINRVPTLIGVSTETAEIRRIKVTEDGFIITISSNPSGAAPALPADAATETKQDTGNTSLGSIDTKLPAQGSAAIAASIPVNIASDQTVPVSAASLPLPTGAATSGNQTTGNSSLSIIAGDTTSLDAKMPSQGAATTANSTPVNIASDQTVAISAASLPLPAGAATSANQTTGNSSLSSIVTNTAKTGNDTPSESFTNVTTAAEVMAASATREGHIICNEGPEVARCGSGSVTTTTGQKLFVDQCYSLDGDRPYKGAISCVSTTGPSTKISVVETN